jgi:hypothetical protein
MPKPTSLASMVKTLASRTGTGKYIRARNPLRASSVLKSALSHTNLKDPA